MKKTTTKKWLRTSVILYIVILSMVAVASFAWFVFEDTVTLQTDDEVIITAGKKLEIARIMDNGEVGSFGQKVTVTDINVTYPDISGDGMVFWYPKTLDGNDETYNHLLESFDKIDMTAPPENYNHYFITINLQFRSDEAVDVYLSNTSYVDGYFDDERQSAYGDFSTDAIAGAARVAFISYDGNGKATLENIWIPNDKYEIKSHSREEYIAEHGEEAYNQFINNYIVENGEVIEFTKDGKRESLEDIGYLLLSGDQLLHESWGTENYELENPMRNYLDRHVTLGKEGLAAGGTDDAPARINNAKPLISFTQEEIKNGKTVKNLTIRIWIEGTDRESNKATAGGKLKYALNFIGIQKESSAGKYDDILAGKTLALNSTTLTYTRANAELPAVDFEYSHNGIDWRSCSNNTIDSETGSKYLYFRVAETIDTKASDWVAVYNTETLAWEYYE